MLYCLRLNTCTHRRPKEIIQSTKGNISHSHNFNIRVSSWNNFPFFQAAFISCKNKIICQIYKVFGTLIALIILITVMLQGHKIIFQHAFAPNLYRNIPTHSRGLCTPAIVQKGEHFEGMLPTLLSNYTNERSHGSCRSFISGAVGCPCLAVPCLGSGFLHCGLGIIINPLGLFRSPPVIWDCWVSIGKGQNKTTQWWRRR